MTDPIDLMVMLVEATELAKSKPALEQDLAKLEAELDAAIARYGFSDPQNVKINMVLPVTRIVQARKIALQQLAGLASREAIDQLDS